MNTIGIRAEDKNRWERRAPLTPDHVRELVQAQDLRVLVEPSDRRVFVDRDYVEAGAELDPGLVRADVILGVKEVPAAKLQAGKVYLYFSHVIKGQEYNMPMLRRILDLGCTLLDYERVTDRRNRRLIFFGRYAGYAGMIDSLWALGQRLAAEGFETPLERILQARQYRDLEDALTHISHAGDEIRHAGLPVGLRPIVTAFTGSGNVSKGAQEIYERLPVQEIEPEDLVTFDEDSDRPRNVVYRTRLERHHRYTRIEGGGFDIAEFDAHPERYRSALDELLPHITMFIHGAYWEPRQPVLISRPQLRHLFSGDQPKLRVIGDITCDIDGSVAATVRPTSSGEPVYVYDPETGSAVDGFEGPGVVVMAIDNLPCELPADASAHFGDNLARFAGALARCDWSKPFEELDLPPELAKAVVAHRGSLTPDFAYLAAPLAKHGGPSTRG